MTTYTISTDNNITASMLMALCAVVEDDDEITESYIKSLWFFLDYLTPPYPVVLRDPGWDGLREEVLSESKILGEVESDVASAFVAQLRLVANDMEFMIVSRKPVSG